MRPWDVAQHSSTINEVLNEAKEALKTTQVPFNSTQASFITYLQVLGVSLPIRNWQQRFQTLKAAIIIH
jgi:hypothetical protein